MKLADLKLNPDNPRNIAEDKLEKLSQSIKDFPKMMVKRPIVYDKDKIIIGGNMRYRAIQKLGLEEIPDEWVADGSDFTPEERHRFIMQDNAEAGTHDWDLVANQYELEDLDAWGIDVPYADPAEDVEEDEAPEVSSEPPVSKLGEVYQLGRHRVMCGDSTDKANVELLMNGQKADMVFTDPPYGIDLDTDLSSIKTELKGWKGQGGKYSKVIGDDKDYDPTHLFEQFADVKEMFLWGADYYAERIPIKNEGSWFVWDKTINQDKGSVTWNLGSMFELCWSKQKHKREVVRKLWAGLYGTETQDERSRIHPTQKPLEVCSWFINKYSKKDQNIIDLFLGSGSTLIACEQTDRTCYGMELDPKYVDVIRKRYAKFTNNNELPENWEELTPEIAGE